MFALIRYSDDPQRFSIEYVNNVVRKYSAAERLVIVASSLLLSSHMSLTLYTHIQHTHTHTHTHDMNTRCVYMYVPHSVTHSVTHSLTSVSPLSPVRDALLCSILDGVRASGNRDICVKMTRTNRGQRLGPLHLPMEEEVESQYLKVLVNTPSSESCDQFMIVR